MIGGVCGGLSDLWQIDVTWIRLGFVVLSLASNVLAGIIIYLILLIAIPEEKIIKNA
ncbi:PspC domain-containing protein [candidate division KSB1 bacterium]|nr:PspC domain-containing protein [candidate division KSB1 bacterium]